MQRREITRRLERMKAGWTGRLGCSRIDHQIIPYLTIHSIECLYASIHKYVLRDVVLRGLVIKIDGNRPTGLRMKVDVVD